MSEPISEEQLAELEGLPQAPVAYEWKVAEALKALPLLVGEVRRLQTDLKVKDHLLHIVGLIVMIHREENWEMPSPKKIGRMVAGLFHLRKEEGRLARQERARWEAKQKEEESLRARHTEPITTEGRTE